MSLGKKGLVQKGLETLKLNCFYIGNTLWTESDMQNFATMIVAFFVSNLVIAWYTDVIHIPLGNEIETRVCMEDTMDKGEESSYTI